MSEKDKRGRGRPPGSLNKIGASLKDMILEATENAGGVSYLQRQADENPGPFLALLGKILPLQVTGDGGGPLKITVISGVPAAEDDSAPQS